VNLELTLAAERGMTLEMDERRVEWQPATTAVKAPKHGGLQRMNRAVTTCRLPLRYCGWGTLAS